MTVKNTEFKSTIAEITDVPNLATSDVNNPFLTKIKFIFADNQGNGNNQGIDEMEFDAIAQSAVNMPIKMKFDGELDGHEQSIPIGHITSMAKETNGDVVQLIGEALLYREEYPQEVKFLKDKFDAGEAPGISWELAYHDSVLKNGIEWLKQVVTMAATFVKAPAYGRRTKLLAIAQQNIGNEEFMTQLKQIVDSFEQTKASDKDIPKGGNKVEEELAKAQAALVELQAKLTDLQGKLDTATTTIDTLTQENTTYKTQATLAARTTKISEAGLKFDLSGDALVAKESFWLSMSDEIFDAYVADMAAAVKAAVPDQKTVASQKQKDGLPKFTAVAGQEITLDDLKAVGRRASRGEFADL